MLFLFSGTADELAALYQPNKRELQIMSEKVDELNTKLDTLDAKISSEHEQVAAAIAEQKQAIQDLKDVVANGANPTELDNAIARVDASIEKVAAIYEPATPAPDVQPV